jgi:hypothetical protein
MTDTSLKVVCLALDNLDEPFWAKQSQDQIEAMRRAAERHVLRPEVVWPISVVVVGFAGIALLMKLAPPGGEPMGNFAFLAPILIAAGAMLGAVIGDVAKRAAARACGDPSRVADQLARLAGTECALALSLAQSVEKAGSYRREVLRTGRAFVRVDLAIMKAMRDREHERQAATNDAQWVRALHEADAAHTQSG